MRLFYGIEIDTPEFARLKAAYRVIDIRNPSGASDEEITRAGAEIVAIARAAAARDAALDVPPSFVAALARQPGALDEDTVLYNLAYMCHTTWGDISGLLTWLFRMLVDNPQWADRLRDAQQSGAPGEAAALAGLIVQETLRLEQSEHLYRVARRDIADEDGTVVPKGWLIRVCVRESHRDPSVFDAAETFDPERFERRTFTRREYSPFGAGGRTACIGEGLTRALAAVFAEEVVRGRRWRTVVDAPPEYGPWRHWRPSSAWRVAVTPA
jgi:cytochrome P450